MIEKYINKTNAGKGIGDEQQLADWKDFDDWIPKDDRFNDEGFVSEPVGKYKSNTWGLHDMHGNVSEWTRSLYKSYPYKDTDGRNNLSAQGKRVARGGSWYDRPKCSTSSYRRFFEDYQKVYNVGFRVIIED
jgi:formylglycine-generating enzyme required for sulfatase activity